MILAASGMGDKKAEMKGKKGENPNVGQRVANDKKEIAKWKGKEMK